MDGDGAQSGVRSGRGQTPRRWPQVYVGIGGAKGDRTPDLLHAMQALSQLSYGPGAANRAPVFRRLPRPDQGQSGRGGGASALLFVARDVGDVLEVDVVLLVLEDLVVEVVIGLDRVVVGVDLGQVLDVDRLGLDLFGPQRLGLDGGQALEREGRRRSSGSSSGRCADRRSGWSRSGKCALRPIHPWASGFLVSGMREIRRRMPCALNFVKGFAVKDGRRFSQNSSQKALDAAQH